MIDDSLVAATRHAQENKALQEEVRLDGACCGAAAACR